MKLEKLIKLSKEKKVRSLGSGASRQAFYVKGHSKDVIKRPLAFPETCGQPEFRNPKFLELVKQYMSGEELEITLKYLTFAKDLCDSRKYPIHVANLAICTERLVSIIVSEKGNKEKKRFARCVEILEKDGIVYGRYENAKYKKIKDNRSWIGRTMVSNNKGEIICHISDVHNGNHQKGVILDFAALELPYEKER